uniref:Galectin n=1 Tax=Gouania willdenowi TaxID=441366 RepID=A0A8C5NEK8_GOUWI
MVALVANLSSKVSSAIFRALVVDLSTRNDIAFHFNTRFNDCGDRNVVVRNSCRGKRWESEERQELKDFPFIKGQTFKVSPHESNLQNWSWTHNEFKETKDTEHISRTCDLKQF